MDKLRLFVYGSLKTGEYNWHVVSAGVESCQPARLFGRLFLRADGYPALVLESHLGRGTSNYGADLAAADGRALDAPASSGGPGRWVEGQVLLVSPGAPWLRRLDEFEGFFPGAESEYVRVLTVVQLPESGNHVTAWTYIAAFPPPADWPPIAEWTGHPQGRLSPYQHGLG